MSRKGVAPSDSSKSKKIPRIFQRRRSASPCSSTDVIPGVGGVVSADRVFGVGYHSCDQRQQRYKNRTKSCKTTTNNNFYTDNGNAEDVETVANIEKWLKTRTESVSSMDLDTIKSEVEEASGDDNRYLADDLPHAFLGKNPDVLSMDIDLSNKKLALGYDPMLQDIRSDKLLEACEKDEFILPTFQLDHLDSLVLTTDDMMVAGEILPSTNTPGISMGISNSSQDSDCGKDERDTMMKAKRLEPGIDSSKRIVNVYVEAVGHVDVETSGLDALENLVEDTEEAAGPNPKLKTKLEPRIIKKRRKASKSDGGSSFRVIKTDEQRNNDGIMAVVAISTDKISNMTQIVINTGKEEQIYQGKTSELIEATGNFPHLSRIGSCSDSQQADTATDCSTSNEHDLVISNALEELGITDDTLEPISSNEHGKVWVCPKDDCRRQFNRLYALKGHVLSHYGVRPFKVLDNASTLTCVFASDRYMNRR